MVAFGSFQQIITNELIEILNRFKSNNKIKIIFRPHPGYQEVPKVDKLSINMKDSFNKLVNKFSCFRCYCSLNIMQKISKS